MNEYEHEDVPGLPAPLPTGERMLWRGAPHWWPFARSAFHARFMIGYFAVLVTCQVLGMQMEGSTTTHVVAAAAWMLTLATVALALALGLGWLYSRSTVYTITDRRVVLRFGVAVPLAVNLPFSVIDGAALKVHADGSGDIALRIAPRQRVGVIQMWPCVQAWRLLAPRPVLRAVPDAARVASLLGAALAATDSQAADTPATSATPRPRRAGLVPGLAA